MTHTKVTLIVYQRPTEGYCEWFSKENRCVLVLLCRFCRFKDVRWDCCNEYFNEV